MPDPKNGDSDDHEMWSGFGRVYRAMLTAREVDRVESELVRQGQAYFHVSAAGHEALAVLADYLTHDDWLHLHYRDKALLLARGLPVREFFSSLLCRADSHSAGRQMSAHYSAPKLRVLSMVGPVGNNALQAVGVAAAVKDQAERPIVVCSVGDGTTQQGEFYEAVSEAVRRHLPVLFLIEDNRLSISTATTGQTFFDLPTGHAELFFGLPIHHIDGTDVFAVDNAFERIVPAVRQSRNSALVVLHVERLSDHTNADDETAYRNAQEIHNVRANADPVRLFEDHLVCQGVSEETLRAIREEVTTTVRDAAAFKPEAPAKLQSPTTQSRKQNFAGASGFNLSKSHSTSTTKSPLSATFTARTEYLGDESQPRLTMREALNRALHERLRTDARVILVGEDIEDLGAVHELIPRVVGSTEFPAESREPTAVRTGASISGVAEVARLRI